LNVPPIGGCSFRRSQLNLHWKADILPPLTYICSCRDCLPWFSSFLAFGWFVGNFCLF
jgi:hypothetical protein